MEHNLGLTCDPIGGLVQVPCIERNAMAASRPSTPPAWRCAATATHLVPLDKVIETMRETGADMKEKYKETARGGLALHVLEAHDFSVGIPEAPRLAGVLAPAQLAVPTGRQPRRLSV